MKSKTLITTICTAAALALVPINAEAKPAGGGFKQATFKATLSGSQVTTWEYHKADDPNNRCDAGSDGYGDQTIKFDAKRTFRVNFTTPPKRQSNLFGTKGRPSVFTTPLFLPVDATAERNGDYIVHYDQAAKDCPGEAGGGGDNVPIPHDCGIRRGGFQTRLYFHDPSPGGDLILPLGRRLPEKNTLKLEANIYEWFQADGASSAVQLEDSYRNCPLLLENTYVERAGNIWTSGAHLSEKTLFNSKRRKIVVSGHTIQKLGGGNSTGKTILAWNLRLTRVK
jgi:hypothetical protein